MRIIDFHTHVYPDKLAVRGSQSICDFYRLKYRQDGSVDRLLSEGRKAGISEYVLLPIAVHPSNVRHINEYTSKTVAAHREFYGFGTLHAAMDNSAGEIDFIEQADLKGVKLHPDSQGFAIDDRRLYNAYDYLQGRMPVLIHCGDPRFEFSRPERLKRVLRDFPRLTVIAAHLGGWSMFEKAFEYLHDEHCFFDISSCIMYLGIQKTADYIHSYGAERIVFGSDFPVWDMKQEVTRFMWLPLTESEREMIAYQNALALLKMGSS